MLDKTFKGQFEGELEFSEEVAAEGGGRVLTKKPL